MLIAHTADVHIRGLQYLDEMEYTLDQFYESVKKEKVDLIVIGGDVYHSKLTVTNEYFDLAYRFFKKLTDLCPVVLIFGNHDLALNNVSRMDALTPVVNALGTTKHPFYFLKSSDETVKIENFHFHCLSVLDEKKDWPNQETIITGLEDGTYKEDDIHIALYHGSINGCAYDNDWISRGNKDDIDIFAGFDYGFLGDIHKFQMMTPRIGYPGSIRQNNFGEDLNKGYLLWDIESKEDYKVSRVILPQKRYFYTIHHNPDEEIPKDLDLKKDCRIQVKLTKRVSISEDLRIRETVKQYYKPCNDVVTKPPEIDLTLVDLKVGDDKISQENLRLPDAQKRLIEQYFKSEELDEDLLASLYRVDEKYNSYIDSNVARNVIWNINKMKWENIFSYGKSNTINFKKISGLIGIFGKNAVGKSSIIDTMCYIIFNKINKEGANKNIDYINFRKKKCKGELDIDFAGLPHSIQRTTERPKSDKTSAINNIQFSCKQNGEKISLNGLDKTKTNLNIKAKFGSLEDFVITSLCPQEKLFSFLNKRGTDKKKFFSSFLDLGIFYEKLALAEKDFSKIKTRLKEYEGIDFTAEILQKKEVLKALENSLKEAFKTKEEYESKLQTVNDRIIEQSSKIKDVSIQYNEKELEDLLARNKEKIEDLKIKISSLSREEKILEDLLPKLEQHTKELELIEKKLSVIGQVESEISQKKNKSKLLEQVPCGDEYPMCPFIADAHKAKAGLRNFDESRLKAKDELKSQRENLLKTIKNTRAAEKRVGQMKIYRVKLENLQLKTDNLNSQKAELDRQRDTIEANKDIFDRVKSLKDQKEKILMGLGVINKEILELTKKDGALNNDLEKLLEDRDKIEKLRQEYHSYVLYLQAMGKNGISYRIISQRLPLVQEEANRILSQVTDFSIQIEDNQDSKSILLYIVSTAKGKRIVELGSGFEKTMVSLALRAALWNLSSLPKTPMLILDEPFAFVEEGKRAATMRMLKYLKNYFTHIFIISHDNAMKSMVDSTIYVSLKEDGFAHCTVN